MHACSSGVCSSSSKGESPQCNILSFYLTFIALTYPGESSCFPDSYSWISISVWSVSNRGLLAQGQTDGDNAQMHPSSPGTEPATLLGHDPLITSAPWSRSLLFPVCVTKTSCVKNNCVKKVNVIQCGDLSLIRLIFWWCEFEFSGLRHQK